MTFLTRATSSLIGMSLLLSSWSSYAWNALGHQIVAQIAYDHLTPQTKQRLEHYNHALDRVFKPQSLVKAASWLDSLYYLNDRWLQPFHYINLPFSIDGTAVKPPNPVNAIVALENNSQVITDPNSNLYNKGFALRILLHVVGDLHQPMHAVTEYSARFPEGDLGGNRVKLAKNTVAENLHAYWDNGAGFLKDKKYYDIHLVEKKARQIEKLWSCSQFSTEFNPSLWAQESHQLAVNKAYRLKFGKKPSRNYQHEAQQIVQKRLAQAGCRLSVLLNHIIG